MKRLLGTLLLLWPLSSSFGGQHSGLGPGTPVAPPPGRYPGPQPVGERRFEEKRVEPRQMREIHKEPRKIEKSESKRR